MVCFGYISVNTLHTGDKKDDNNNNNNNNNNIKKIYSKMKFTAYDMLSFF
jgi:hypothetical protein